MQVGQITRDNLTYFEGFLLTDVLEPRTRRRTLLLGLVDDGVACGAIAASMFASDLNITSLYVSPDYRRKGGGRLLIDTLCNVMEGKYDYLTVDFTLVEKDMQTLVPFLEQLDFEEADSRHQMYAFPVAKLADTPFFQEHADAIETKPLSTVTFSQIPYALNKAYKGFKRKGIYYAGVPMSDPTVDADCSVAIMRNGEPVSILMFTKVDARLLILSVVIADRPTDIGVLFNAALPLVQKKYSLGTILAIDAINDTTERMIHKVLPDAIRISHHFVR